MALIVQGRQQNKPRLMATGAATVEVGLGADTTHGEAHFLLGVAHQQLGNLNRAVPALERAVRIDPGIPHRLHALAQAYEAVGRDPAVIERLYQRALHLQPALADVRVDYGHFLQAQGRIEEALVMYEGALAAQPWYPLAAFQRGTALLELGQHAKAERAAQDAVRLDPAYAGVLARVLFFETTGTASDERFVDARLLSLASETAIPDTHPIRIIPDPGGARFVNLPPNSRVQVYTRNGVLLRTLEKREAAPTMNWDLRTDAGPFIPSGLYLIHIRALNGADNAPETTVLRWAAVHKHTP